MQIRRFTAANISKALEMVKAELGSNAIILSTEKRRREKPDSRGFLSYTEVVAAVDREENKQPEPRTPPDAPAEKAASGNRNDLSLKDLSGEVKDIQKTLSRMSMLMEQFIKKDEDRACRTQPGSLSEIDIALSGLGLDSKTRGFLSASILSSFSQHPVTGDQVRAWLRNYIHQGLRPGPVAENAHEPVWWAFIGPTGVGKTTTLAKIAARLKFLKKHTGVLVSADCYRLGAIDQLRKYARLMDLPLETARTTKDLLKIFSRHREKDFILVDTTGRNPFSSSHSTELQRIFDAVPGLMAQVMLCSTYKREDLMESINFYKQFPNAGWTLTKTDETRSPAAAIFSVLQAELPVSYVTNGQRVPEDIEAADSDKLCKRLLFPSECCMGTGSDALTHLNATLC